MMLLCQTLEGFYISYEQALIIHLEDVRCYVLVGISFVDIYAYTLAGPIHSLALEYLQYY